jgi:hypothetical protein
MQEVPRGLGARQGRPAPQHGSTAALLLVRGRDGNAAHGHASVAVIMYGGNPRETMQRPRQRSRAGRMPGSHKKRRRSPGHPRRQFPTWGWGSSIWTCTPTAQRPHGAGASHAQRAELQACSSRDSAAKPDPADFCCEGEGEGEGLGRPGIEAARTVCGVPLLFAPILLARTCIRKRNVWS